VSRLEVLEAQNTRLHAERTAWVDRVTVARLEADELRGELRSARSENLSLRAENDKFRKAVGAVQALLRSKVWQDNSLSRSPEAVVVKLRYAVSQVPPIDRRSRSLAEVYGLSGEHKKSPAPRVGSEASRSSG